jgi:PAS domain S-box-containing protein
MKRGESPGGADSAEAETILVVDDSESVQALSQGALEELGYEILCVERGAEAIRWLSEHRAILVLLDYRLPDMTGRDIVRTLAERGRHFPFVAITAHGDEKIAVEMMKLGALDYLAKDEVFADMLPAVVRQVLGKLEIEKRLAVAEHAAKESEGRFRSIFENAAAGMATISPEGRILQVNPELCRFLGYEAQKWLMLDIEAISHPDDRDQTLRLYRELRDRKRSSFGYEKRYIRRDGSTVWGHASVAGVYDEGDNLLYCIALVQDITGRKRYEELADNIDRGVAIKTGDDFFRSLADYLAKALKADCVFVGELLPLPPERIRSIAAVSDGREGATFEYLLPGTPCENVVRQKLRVYPDRVAELFPEDHLLAEMGVEGYAGAPLLGSSGETLGLLVVLFRQRIADPDMVESLLRIFSIRAAAELERRQGEQALRQSERRYKKLSQEFEALLDGIPDVLLLLASDRRVIWANRAAQARVAVPEQVAAKKCCHYFCAARGGAEDVRCDKCPVAASFATGENGEQVIKHPDATLWGVKTFPLKDRDGQVNRVILLASDITEKRRLRDEAERAGRLAAVGELAAGVAHEINNPTGLVLMNMPVLKAAFEDAVPLLDEHFRRRGDFLFGGIRYSHMKEQLPLLIDEILDGAQRIGNIVDDMKNFARGGHQEESRLFDLNETVKRAVRLAHNQVKSATDHFSCELANDLAMVRGNPQRIEQVLVNLIINACQALPEKNRRLDIGTRIDAGRNLCRVIVRDEGVGIAEKDLPQLTDPFFTTKREYGGTGLGLSVSARIVREHGGSLRFESSPGQGTTVTLALPAAPGEHEG